MSASLILSDGTRLSGQSFGAPLAAGDSSVFGSGEVVFNTGMVGYPESMTDPSYRGQILVFTYPLIGNYGVPSEELNEYGFSKHLESEDIHVRGVVCSQLSEHYSHHEAKKSLDAWMKEKGIPGITGVDTRALTKKLREEGVMLGRIVERSDEPLDSARDRLGAGSWEQVEDPNLRNLVAEVSCREVVTYTPASSSLRSAQHDNSCTIVAYDCGMKRNIIRSFLKRGVTVVRVPWNFDLASADFHYDGVFISNGPGDPKMCVPTIESIRYALEKNIPTFGICLGNQLLALAIGGDTYKLKYGHRGANQPCVEVGASSSVGNFCHPERSETETKGKLPTSAQHDNHKCIITSQNHGFAVSDQLPEGWHVWFKNANDGTIEGIRHESKPFFSVQFHPEATPGPEDANYLFDLFVSRLVGR